MSTPTLTSTPERTGSPPEREDDVASVSSDSFVANRSTRYQLLDRDGVDFVDEYNDDIAPPSRSAGVKEGDVGSGDDAEDLCDEDLEPPLKYERLSNDLRQMVSNEKATALVVHPKFIVLGTSWGNLHMFDATGHARSHTEFKLHSHSVGVAQVSVDHAGEFVASCSGLDGRVVVTGLCSKLNNHDITLPRRVNSVALDPLYARAGSGRRFLTGDDRVILHEKTYFNRYKQSVLTSPSDGPITNIRWRGYFAAWCCRRGVVVFDVLQERIISIVKFDQPLDPNPPVEEERSRGDLVTRIAWSDQYTLYVCHGDTVRICGVKRRPQSREQLKHHDLPEHYVVIKSSFRLKNSWVCGVAPKVDSGNKVVVLLTVRKAGDHAPEMMLVEPLESSYNLVSLDSLPALARFGPHDYQLEHSVEDGHYFVVGPSEVLIGRPRDIDDNIDWCLAHGDFERALMLAESNRRMLLRHTAVDVGKRHVDRLLDGAKFEDAAALCVRVFGTDRRLWQDEAVVKFALLHQLRALAPHLPADSVRLDPQCYEMVLCALARDREAADLLLELVRDRWAPNLYDVGAVASAVLESLLRESSEPLMLALATLYAHQRKHEKAVEIYLELGRHRDAFALIRKHDLFDAVHDKIPALMELDAREASRLFLEHLDRLDPEVVAGKLDGRHLHVYLDALLSKNWEESRKFHGRLVALYADYEPDKLLPFLKASTSYGMREALEACRLRGLTRECVFILARMGDTRQALSLITRELGDIDEAVEFCKECDDPDLWEDLIEYSVDKPLFIHVLLLNIGTYIDPRILVRRIEPGLRIPGLRESLATIMHDHHLQVTLQEGCKKILVSDCLALTAKQVAVQSRGTAVGADVACGACGAMVVQPSAVGGGNFPSSSNNDDFLVLMCKHVFHARCLPDEQSYVCTMCDVKSKAR